MAGAVVIGQYPGDGALALLKLGQLLLVAVHSLQVALEGLEQVVGLRLTAGLALDSDPSQLLGRQHC